MDAQDWDARYESEDRVWSEGPNEFLPPEVAGMTPGRALDLAAGEGRNSIWLARQGWRVTAVDFSEVGMSKGRAASEDLDIEWVVADLFTFEAEHDGYELIIEFYLHLPREQHAYVLGRAVDSLAPGGTLLVVGHDVTNLEHGHGGPQYPEILHDPQEVASVLDGLEIVRAERVDRVYEPGAIAIDSLVRAVKPT